MSFKNLSNLCRIVFLTDNASGSAEQAKSFNISSTSKTSVLRKLRALPMGRAWSKSIRWTTSSLHRMLSGFKSQCSSVAYLCNHSTVSTKVWQSWTRSFNDAPNALVNVFCLLQIPPARYCGWTARTVSSCHFVKCWSCDWNTSIVSLFACNAASPFPQEEVWHPSPSTPRRILSLMPPHYRRAIVLLGSLQRSMERVCLLFVSITIVVEQERGCATLDVDSVGGQIEFRD